MEEGGKKRPHEGEEDAEKKLRAGSLSGSESDDGGMVGVSLEKGTDGKTDREGKEDVEGMKDLRKQFNEYLDNKKHRGLAGGSTEFLLGLQGRKDWEDMVYDFLFDDGSVECQIAATDVKKALPWLSGIQVMLLDAIVSRDMWVFMEMEEEPKAGKKPNPKRMSTKGRKVVGEAVMMALELWDKASTFEELVSPFVDVSTLLLGRDVAQREMVRLGQLSFLRVVLLDDTRPLSKKSATEDSIDKYAATKLAAPGCKKLRKDGVQLHIGGRGKIPALLMLKESEGKKQFGDKVLFILGGYGGKDNWVTKDRFQAPLEHLGVLMRKWVAVVKNVEGQLSEEKVGALLSTEEINLRLGIWKDNKGNPVEPGQDINPMTKWERAKAFGEDGKGLKEVLEEAMKVDGRTVYLEVGLGIVPDDGKDLAKELSLQELPVVEHQRVWLQTESGEKNEKTYQGDLTTFNNCFGVPFAGFFLEDQDGQPYIATRIGTSKKFRPARVISKEPNGNDVRFLVSNDSRPIAGTSNRSKGEMYALRIVNELGKRVEERVRKGCPDGKHYLSWREEAVVAYINASWIQDSNGWHTDASAVHSHNQPFEKKEMDANWEPTGKMVAIPQEGKHLTRKGGAKEVYYLPPTPQMDVITLSFADGYEKGLQEQPFIELAVRKARDGHKASKESKIYGTRMKVGARGGHLQFGLQGCEHRAFWDNAPDKKAVRVVVTGRQTLTPQHGEVFENLLLSKRGIQWQNPYAEYEVRGMLSRMRQKGRGEGGLMLQLVGRAERREKAEDLESDAEEEEVAVIGLHSMPNQVYAREKKEAMSKWFRPFQRVFTHPLWSYLMSKEVLEAMMLGSENVRGMVYTEIRIPKGGGSTEQDEEEDKIDYVQVVGRTPRMKCFENPKSHSQFTEEEVFLLPGDLVLRSDAEELFDMGGTDHKTSAIRAKERDDITHVVMVRIPEKNGLEFNVTMMNALETSHTDKDAMEDEKLLEMLRLQLQPTELGPSGGVEMAAGAQASSIAKIAHQEAASAGSTSQATRPNLLTNVVTRKSVENRAVVALFHPYDKEYLKKDRFNGLDKGVKEEVTKGRVLQFFGMFYFEAERKATMNKTKYAKWKARVTSECGFSIPKSREQFATFRTSMHVMAELEPFLINAERGTREAASLLGCYGRGEDLEGSLFKKVVVTKNEKEIMRLPIPIKASNDTIFLDEKAKALVGRPIYKKCLVDWEVQGQTTSKVVGAEEVVGKETDNPAAEDNDANGEAVSIRDLAGTQNLELGVDEVMAILIRVMGAGSVRFLRKNVVLNAKGEQVVRYLESDDDYWCLGKMLRCTPLPFANRLYDVGTCFLMSLVHGSVKDTFANETARKSEADEGIERDAGESGPVAWELCHGKNLRSPILLTSILMRVLGNVESFKWVFHEIAKDAKKEPEYKCFDEKFVNKLCLMLERTKANQAMGQRRKDEADDPIGKVWISRHLEGSVPETLKRDRTVAVTFVRNIAKQVARLDGALDSIRSASGDRFIKALEAVKDALALSLVVPEKEKQKLGFIALQIMADLHLVYTGEPWGDTMDGIFCYRGYGSDQGCSIWKCEVAKKSKSGKGEEEESKAADAGGNEGEDMEEDEMEEDETIRRVFEEKQMYKEASYKQWRQAAKDVQKWLDSCPDWVLTILGMERIDGVVVDRYTKKSMLGFWLEHFLCKVYIAVSRCKGARALNSPDPWRPQAHPSMSFDVFLQAFHRYVDDVWETFKDHEQDINSDFPLDKVFWMSVDMADSIEQQ